MWIPLYYFCGWKSARRKSEEEEQEEERQKESRERERERESVIFHLSNFELREHPPSITVAK